MIIMESLSWKKIYRGAAAALLAAAVLVVIGSIGLSPANATGETTKTWTTADTLRQFPLAKGSKWVYTGTRIAQEGSIDAIEREIGFKIEVLDQYAFGDSSLFILSNYFDTVEFFGEPTADGGIECPDTRCALLATGNRIYFIDPAQVDPVIKQFKDKTFQIEDNELLTDDAIRFRFPMTTGDQYGSISEAPRDDSMYCWAVSNLPGKSKTSFITMATMPDVTQLAFTPTKGVVSYNYHHNGTICDIQMYLESYQK